MRLPDLFFAKIFYQEQEVYFERQTVTLVEVAKFLKNAKDFADDNCRLAP